MQSQQYGQNPGCHRRHGDDNERVHQTLQARPHIQLGKVNAAGNEREARDDEEHGADIPGLVLEPDMQEHLQQPEQDRIRHARGRYGNHNVQEQGKVPLDELAADKVTYAGAPEGAEHLHKPAAKKKRKRPAGERRREAQSTARRVSLFHPDRNGSHRMSSSVHVH